MQLQYFSAIPLFFLALLGVFPVQGEESNTGLFTVFVRNNTFPDIDGKVSSFSGVSILDSSAPLLYLSHKSTAGSGRH
jgi:hypothetical protein